jgi:N-glycosidase YbiA
MKLLVCGGRNFKDIEFACNVLGMIHQEHPITCLVHGAAKGADTIGGAWAEELGIPTEVYPAEWERYGKSAGPIRNEKMFRTSKPDGLLVLPGGRGTEHMWKHAHERKPDLLYWRSERVYFRKENLHWFCSNFATGFGFTDSDDVYWPTSEHFYQAGKTTDPRQKERVRVATTPYYARKKGRIVQEYTEEEWDDLKDSVMQMALSYKFAPGTVAAGLLLDTGIDYLVEYAPWGDTYWGVDRRYKGRNKLGKFLMEWRSALRETTELPTSD